MLVLDDTTLGLPLLLRSFSRMELVVLLPNMQDLGPLLFPQELAWLGRMAFVMGMTRLEPSLLAYCASEPDSTMLPRSFAYLGLASFLFDVVHLDLPPLLHTFN